MGRLKLKKERRDLGGAFKKTNKRKKREKKKREGDEGEVKRIRQPKVGGKGKKG